MRHALALAAAALLCAALACRTPGAFVPRMEGLEVEDTLGALARSVRGAKDDRAAGEAWSAYLERPELAPDADLGAVKPESLGKAIRASLPQLEAVSAAAPGEAREVAAAVAKLHGRSVSARVWLVALRGDGPLEEENGRLLLNARSAAAADPKARQALLARAMGASLLPDTGSSLGPLAAAVYARSLGAAAALAVVPDAPLHALTGRPEEESARLRARLPLLARELLASLDSASPAQVDRFFGASGTDPLVPRGAGALLSVELGSALTGDLGSAEKAVRLTPGEFRRQASQALQRMTAAQ